MQLQLGRRVGLCSRNVLYRTVGTIGLHNVIQCTETISEIALCAQGTGAGFPVLATARKTALQITSWVRGTKTYLELIV